MVVLVTGGIGCNVLMLGTVGILWGIDLGGTEGERR